MTVLNRSLSQLFEIIKMNDLHFGILFKYIHKLNDAHWILVAYCKHGKTNFSVGVLCLVTNKACTRFDSLYDLIISNISS